MVKDAGSHCTGMRGSLWERGRESSQLIRIEWWLLAGRWNLKVGDSIEGNKVGKMKENVSKKLEVVKKKRTRKGRGVTSCDLENTFMDLLL